MLAKRKSGLKACSEGQQPGAPLTVGVSKISMADYEMFYCYKDQLKEMAKPFGEIKVSENGHYFGSGSRCNLVSGSGFGIRIGSRSAKMTHKSREKI
jgi:hypothetical protein